MSRKCNHGKNFCCECQYGLIRQENAKRVLDLVDEAKVPLGYKLLNCNMGDIKEREE